MRFLEESNSQRKLSGNCQRLGWEEMEKLLSNGNGIAVWDDEKGIWWWQIHDNTNILNIAELYALTMVNMVSFILSILHQNKK
jgi:hypothetical protein